MNHNASINGLAQVAVTVRDLGRARNFYQQTLGLPFLFEAPNIAFFKLGDLRLMLSQGADSSVSPNAQAGSTNGTYLYLRVAGLPNMVERLDQAKVTIIEPARMIASLTDRDVWLAFIDDGEGNKLGLMEEIIK